MPPRDHMHMQLRHLIAERGYVELVAPGDVFQRACGRGDLPEQLHLRVFLEIDELDQRGQPRYEDQPRIVRILRKQHAGERQVADRNPYPARAADAVTSPS